jgi:hypothetical protein
LYKLDVFCPERTLHNNPPQHGGTTTRVGDVSSKHRVGDSRIASVFGWKSDSKPVGNTNCHPNTGSLSATADQPFGERLPTTIRALMVAGFTRPVGAGNELKNPTALSGRKKISFPIV